MINSQKLLGKSSTENSGEVFSSIKVRFKTFQWVPQLHSIYPEEHSEKKHFLYIYWIFPALLQVFLLTGSKKFKAGSSKLQLTFSEMQLGKNIFQLNASLQNFFGFRARTLR